MSNVVIRKLIMIFPRSYGEIIEQYIFPVPLIGRKILGKGEKHDLFYV